MGVQYLAMNGFRTLGTCSSQREPQQHEKLSRLGFGRIRRVFLEASASASLERCRWPKLQGAIRSGPSAENQKKASFCGEEDPALALEGVQALSGEDSVLSPCD